MALDILNARLSNQRLTGTPLASPADVVSWLGAVQAQEYDQAKWALAMRSRRTSAAAIDRALTDGAILRTHVLRPTWHFVTPADIRWMLALTGPRISKAMASYNRRFELDAAVFRKSENVIARALRGGVQLTRQELKVALQRGGVNADGVERLAFLTIQAEIDAVICSGGRRGNQSTYALLDERVPSSRPLSREDALGELTRRYYSSHGPAQIHDFAWWSGLTVGDARAGLEMVASELKTETVDGRSYWFGKTVRSLTVPRRAYLLGLYDEYLIAYKDRSVALDRSQWTRITSADAFLAPVILDGRVIAGWKKAARGEKTLLRVKPFAPPGRTVSSAVAEAVDRYASFSGQDLELAWE